jgi:hypothetical protein
MLAHFETVPAFTNSSTDICVDGSCASGSDLFRLSFFSRQRSHRAEAAQRCPSPIEAAVPFPLRIADARGNRSDMNIAVNRFPAFLPVVCGSAAGEFGHWIEARRPRARKAALGGRDTVPGTLRVPSVDNPEVPVFNFGHPDGTKFPIAA